MSSGVSHAFAQASLSFDTTIAEVGISSGIVRGDELYVGTGVGNSGTWINSNNRDIVIASSEHWTVRIVTSNHGDWRLIAQGEVPLMNIVLTYQDGGPNSNRTGVYKSNFAILSEGEISIANRPGTGHASINGVSVTDIIVWSYLTPGLDPVFPTFPTIPIVPLIDGITPELNPTYPTFPTIPIVPAIDF